MSAHQEIKDGNQSVIIFKTWHFVVSQVLLFIALFGAINAVTNNFDKKYYPKEKGIALEQSVNSLDSTLKELNKTLVDLRVMFAKEEGRKEVQPNSNKTDV